MDDKPRTVADQDDDEPADGAADSGPLGALVERGSNAVEFEDTPETLNRPSQPSTASTDYAEGTSEHDDDREG